MVTGPAYGNQRASNALQFAHALLTCGHRLGIVFFYQDGVGNSNRLSMPASDEVDLVRAWHNLSQKHSVALHVCASAAMRRGIADDVLQLGFKLSGLGTLSQAMISCDRFIQF
ncbi:Sulfurtransferase TusD [Sodalis endosymbiont of Henestaris halophilus]|uniref:sulfurtransferase complex subunit TusD n=1 Tax=Sodalis endosymbiont of Henestaris halophilus TaxID=1929246 RepID=UPI000BBF3E3B|nr:sulfurtransferase complex subunit TusD [Sodalis endosymbiont of Henestaris halophilus]SNC58375.1 Sulfurtransferase TusD [Sodalis endosymbiont of Henestaris halophilus]